MTVRKLQDGKYSSLLFWLCWLAYTMTYIGRLNYNASIAEILVAENITKAQAGLISTGTFITYGVGQLVNGMLGDRVSSKWLMFLGLTGSALMNLLMGFSSSFSVMLVLWSINGFMQSMTWSPVVKLFTDYLLMERRRKALIDIATCVPAGTLLAYGLTAALVAVSSWRAVFFCSFGLVFVTAIVWYFGISKVERRGKNLGVLAEEEDSSASADPPAAAEESASSFLRTFLISGAFVASIGIVMHGILKDGVTTWAPTFLGENFGLAPEFSILATTILPIVNLLGVYSASWLNRRWLHNELSTASVFFAAALLAIVLLTVCGSASFVVSLILMAVITSAMLGVNTMTISLMPMYFAKFGRASTASGVLNSLAYLGSAISSYATGSVAGIFGWDVTILFWGAAALLGGCACVFTKKRWGRFCTQTQ